MTDQQIDEYQELLLAKQAGEVYLDELRRIGEFALAHTVTKTLDEIKSKIDEIKKLNHNPITQS